MSPRAREIKGRISKRDFINFKNFCTAKKNISKVKREPTLWQNALLKTYFRSRGSFQCVLIFTENRFQTTYHILQDPTWPGPCLLHWTHFYAPPYTLSSVHTLFLETTQLKAFVPEVPSPWNAPCLGIHMSDFWSSRSQLKSLFTEKPALVTKPKVVNSPDPMLLL